ncbi:MAG: NAD(P)-dependent oxidoreductase [Polyangia bacterium]|jgi:nucleoside-diphosphate-sugar epimerase|nr:NAD(P)-dependent oxidoreductase [Polyangia bacterium]
MRVLVTGANGFLGSHLVERLLGEGDEVVALVRPGSDLRWLAGVRSRISLREARLDQPEALARSLDGVEALCHLAGATRARPDSRYEEINLGGTRALLRACERSGSRPVRFVLCSSLSAGGPAGREHPKRETDPDAPRSAYGRSKKGAEAAIFHPDAGVEALALRPGPIYGPRDSYFFEVLRLARLGLHMRVGPPDALYNFCYVTDVARAFALGCRAQGVAGRHLYIGGDTNYRAEEMEELLARAVDVRKRLGLPLPDVLVRTAAALSEALTPRRAGAPPLNRDKARDLTAGSWGIDVSEAARRLGWRPEVEFSAGLARTVAWYRAEGLL